MPIIPNKKILFIHIPKTGGSYIEWEMRMNYHEDYLFSTTDDGIHSNKVHFHLQHMNFQTIVNEKFLEFDYIDSFFKFTFIRNPYTRTLSEYFWRYGLNEFDSEKFHLFVIDNYMNPVDAHFLPQSFYFDIEYDFVGKFESLKDDLQSLYNILNIEYSISDDRRNISKFNKRDLIPNIDKKTIQTINKLFESDFKLGNYNKI